MAQKLKVLVIFTNEVWPPAPTWCLATIYDSSSRGPNTLLGPLKAVGMHIVHIRTHRHTYIHTGKTFTYIKIEWINLKDFKQNKAKTSYGYCSWLFIGTMLQGPIAEDTIHFGYKTQKKMKMTLSWKPLPCWLEHQPFTGTILALALQFGG